MQKEQLPRGRAGVGQLEQRDGSGELPGSGLPAEDDGGDLQRYFDVLGHSCTGLKSGESRRKGTNALESGGYRAFPGRKAQRKQNLQGSPFAGSLFACRKGIFPKNIPVYGQGRRRSCMSREKVNKTIYKTHFFGYTMAKRGAGQAVRLSPWQRASGR